MEVFLTASAQEISDGMINRVRVRRANFVIAPELLASRAMAQENAAGALPPEAVVVPIPGMPIPGVPIPGATTAESPSSAAA